MLLKELNLGKEAKCICSKCQGTGLYKGSCEKEDLGVICFSCNGLGYYNLELNEKKQLVQDEETKVVYIISNGLITGHVNLFDKLQTRDDINYVMYVTGRVLSPDYLFSHGASEINVIRYKDFLEGKWPLPMTQYTCPRQIAQLYGINDEFDNDCGFGFLHDCEKFGTQECWEKFYGEAKTVEEKQAVLKKER